MPVVDPEADDHVDTALLEAMYSRHAVEARALASAFLHDEHLAADAVQAAFVQIMRTVPARDLPTDPGQARAMVLRNTRWMALNLLRGRRRRREQGGEVLADRDQEVLSWVRSEARLLSEHLVARLPRHYQEVIHLRYVEGLSDAVAAARMGIALRAYQGRLDRALRAARRLAGGRRPAGLAGLLWRVVRRRPARRRQGGRRRVAPRRWGVPTLHLAVLLPGALLVAHALGVAWSPSAPRPALVGSRSGVEPLGAIASGVRVVEETPEDTVITSLAAAPQYGRTHTLVGVGQGRRCGCSVVLQSSDGGASWRAAPGPAAVAGAQVVLPGDYPEDPRIFVGEPAAAAAPDLVSPGFGLPFTPLAAPPGPLALMPLRAGHGEERVVVLAGATPLVFDPVSGAVVRLSAGAGSPIGGIAAVAATGEGLILLSSPSNRDGGRRELLRCTAELHCAPTGAVATGAGPVRLVLSPTFDRDHTLAVHSRTAIAVSTDGGRTFTAVSRPAGAALLGSVALVPRPGATPALLVSADDASGMPELAIAPPGAGWRIVQARGGGGPFAGEWEANGELIAADSGTLLALQPFGGLACSDDRGTSWEPRCRTAG